MYVPWILCGLLGTIIAALSVKLYIFRKNIEEMCQDFRDIRSKDTNNQIFVSSNDKYIKAFAVEMNRQLHELRVQQRKYLSGDRELKEAVTNISHDLRTPLTAICGYLDLLEKEEKSENVTRYFTYIKNRTEALRQLTEELFRYSVMMSTSKEMEFEMVDVNSVLEESIASYYAALVERGITPTIHIPDKKMQLCLNKAALSRIFSNLISNALKYSDGDLSIALLDDGKIIFQNTATKLNEVQVGKMFDRFYSVEAARNSTGLGLAISKTLVLQMNGTIRAQYKDSVLTICIEFTKLS